MIARLGFLATVVVFWTSAAAGAEGRTGPEPLGKVEPVDKTGLVAHYTFDEGSGTVLKDRSGNQNHGRIHGATYVESPWGHALRFDGENDYVNLGTYPVFATRDLMSLWRHPTNGLLAAVANLTREPVDVEVAFNLDKLGLAQQVTAKDVWRAGLRWRWLRPRRRHGWHKPPATRECLTTSAAG